MSREPLRTIWRTRRRLHSLVQLMKLKVKSLYFSSPTRSKRKTTDLDRVLQSMRRAWTWICLVIRSPLMHYNQILHWMSLWMMLRGWFFPGTPIQQWSSLRTVGDSSLLKVDSLHLCYRKDFWMSKSKRTNRKLSSINSISAKASSSQTSSSIMDITKTSWVIQSRIRAVPRMRM